MLGFLRGGAAPFAHSRRECIATATAHQWTGRPFRRAVNYGEAVRRAAPPNPLWLLALAGCAAAPTPATPMNANPIVQAGHPVLRQRAAEVPPAQLGSPELRALVDRMVQAMREAPGVGLAAPQLGVGLRVFVLEDRAELHASLSAEELAERERVPVPLKVFVNPSLTLVGEDRVTFFEGCLSVNGWAGLTPRHREVEVRALDVDGTPFTWRVRGWPARIVQHEFDHLEGGLYLDRMHPRSFGTLPQVKERFGGKPKAEILGAFGLGGP
jgi:peptide deformylase